jgi:hypothetical protein
MNRSVLRRLARLEALTSAHVKKKEESSRDEYDLRRKLYFGKVAGVCLLTLYGKPRIDEPLLDAWDRVRKSAAWQACQEAHPDFAEVSKDYEGEFDELERDFYGIRYFERNARRSVVAPFDKHGARTVGEHFEAYFLPDLPGADEIEKINAILARTPRWLLWFANMEVAALPLGFKLPDLRVVARFARKHGLRCELPEGPFERKLRPPGVDDWLNNLLRRPPGVDDWLNNLLRDCDEAEKDPSLGYPTPR